MAPQNKRKQERHLHWIFQKVFVAIFSIIGKKKKVTSSRKDNSSTAY
jgi:hypothetical protein